METLTSSSLSLSFMQWTNEILKRRNLFSPTKCKHLYNSAGVLHCPQQSKTAESEDDRRENEVKGSDKEWKIYKIRICPRGPCRLCYLNDSWVVVEELNNKVNCEFQSSVRRGRGGGGGAAALWCWLPSTGLLLSNGNDKLKFLSSLFAPFESWSLCHHII